MKYPIFVIALVLAVAGCRTQNPSSKEPSADTTKAPSLKPAGPLAFTLSKDEKGVVWINFYLHNRGQNNVLICDRAEWSLILQTKSGEEKFPFLEEAQTKNPVVFYLLDPIPPGRARYDNTCLSERVRFPEIYLPGFIGFSRLPAEEMEGATLCARWNGAVLRWDPTSGDYVDCPAEVSSSPQPWNEVSEFFKSLPGP